MAAGERYGPQPGKGSLDRGRRLGRRSQQSAGERAAIETLVSVDELPAVPISSTNASIIWVMWHFDPFNGHIDEFRIAHV